MTKKVTFSLVAMLALASTAFATETASTDSSTVETKTVAQVPAENSHADGFYVGLGYGMTSFTDGDFGKEFDNFKVAPDNDTDSGFKLYGGYKFNEIVGVEGSYVNYGTMDFKYTENGSGTATEIKPWSLNVAANLGYDFFDDQLRPFALAGLGYVAYGQSGQQDLYSTDSSLAGVFGLGVEYTPTLFQGVGFRLAYDSSITAVTMTYSDSNKDDKAFIQSFSMISLSAQYRF